MKSRTLSFSLGMLAISAALAASSAQACMFGPSMSQGSPACEQRGGNAQPCPLQGEHDRGEEGCVLSQQDVSNAVNNIGLMAASGIGIAANVMRALSDQANRLVSPN